MTDATAPYARLSHDERRLIRTPMIEGISALWRLVPLGRDRFDRRLARAMADAAGHSGFYLGGFAAHRALAGALIIDINPAILEQRLEHRLKQAGRVCSIRDRFLGAGDWGPLLTAIGGSSTHREVVEVVAAGFDYRATPSYHRALARALGPKPVRRNFVVLSSPAKVESYFRQTAELCQSVHEHGVVSRGDYGWRLASPGTGSVRLPWIELGELDIGVAVGPAGELYRFASGKHRTAVAQALKLKSIPVEIRLVHLDWLARQMAETGLSPADALVEGVRTARFASI